MRDGLLANLIVQTAARFWNALAERSGDSAFGEENARRLEGGAELTQRQRRKVDPAKFPAEPKRQKLLQKKTKQTKTGHFFRSRCLLAIYRSYLRFNSLPARVQPLDFPLLDGLERLRRDRCGSAVAFHPGTRHPQLGFDKEPMKP